MGPGSSTCSLGQAPGGGTLTARPGLRRRHGWDLVFAAPKSLSLLAAAGPEADAAKLRGAYRQAVTDTVATLEDRAAWARRAGDLVPAQVVAGAFEHHDNDAGHPHLHAHVVLANLGLAGDGKWSCLVGDELWRWREGLGAGFPARVAGTPGRGRVRLHVGALQRGPGRDRHRSSRGCWPPPAPGPGPSRPVPVRSGPPRGPAEGWPRAARAGQARR
jgi:hypothetical protein